MSEKRNNNPGMKNKLCILSHFMKCIILIGILILLLSCNGNNLTGNNPEAGNGIMDLAGWDFSKNASLNLSGQWKITGTDQITGEILPLSGEYGTANIGLPFLLEKQIRKQYKNLWLYLKVVLSPQPDLGVLFTPPYTPYRLYINNEEIQEIKENDLREQYIKLTPAAEYTICIRLILTGKNYDEMIYPITLGNIDKLKTNQWQENFINIIILGILLMMFIYHLILWFGRNKDKASLYFAFICLLFFIYTLVTKRLLRYPFPIVSINLFELEYKVAYLSIAAGWYLILLFLNSLFPDESKKKIITFFQISSLIFCLVTLLTLKGFYSRFRFLYFLILGLSSIYAVFISIKAIKNKREGAALINTGIFIFILTVIFDIIKGIFEFNYFIYISHLGFIILLFFQATAIAVRFLKAFQTAEYLSVNLRKEVMDQTAVLTVKKKELELLNVKLQDVNNQQRVFFQNITHEFRTPLTLILAPLESLLLEKKDKMSEDIVRQLEIIRRNSLQLLNLINQLLDISRIDAEEIKIHWEQIDIIKMFRYFKDAFHSLAEKKNIQFNLHTPLSTLILPVDKNMLERIIINLLSNAFKFTDNGGQIDLELHYPCYFGNKESNGKKNEAYGITIRDTGIGISKEHINIIFERFRQVDDSSTRKYSGTGIGLAIVKEYVVLLGGTIDVLSEKDRGTEFNLLFPVPEGEKHPVLVAAGNKYSSSYNIQDNSWQPESELISNTATGIRKQELIDIGIDKDLKKKLVLVDNDREMRAYLARILEEQFQIIEAEDGVDGLEKIKSSKPHIIITDLVMPRMDGYALIQEIRKNTAMADVPVLMITAKAVRDFYKNPDYAEPTDFLAKPFSDKEVKMKVRNLLKISSLVLKEEKLPETAGHYSFPAGNNELHREKTRDSENEFQSEYNSQKNTIFLVENNLDLIYFIRSSLKDRYNFQYATNGRLALEKLSKYPLPDVIISDIMMDEMDGITFYKKLREKDELKTIPFIFLTAKSTLIDKLDGLAAGAVDYINKPFSIQELKLKLNSITEKQKLREMLHEKDKFSVIGKVFAGLFHEIMNPLGATYAALENLENYIETSGLDENGKIHEYLTRSCNNLSRINKLIVSFRKLHYKQEMEEETINMQVVCESLKEIFQHKLRDINFHYQIDEKVKIITNTEILTHILTNLVANAIDAIHGKGAIKITVQRHEGRPEIIVSDTGKGIKKENIPHVFRPFFTNKEDGEGQGLGLYIVREFLLKIKWSIELYSNEGEGTTIILRG